MTDCARIAELQKKEARKIRRAMKCMNRLFITLLIVGTLVAAVLTLVFELKSGKDPSKYKGKIVYFAIFLGDTDVSAASYNNSGAASKCSLELNIDHIRHSIETVEHPTLRYSFITFDESANVTSPMEVDQARHKLIDIQPNGKRQFNQTAVMVEFVKLVQNKEEDLLVHFIPCKYQYDQGGEDTEHFVKGLKKFAGRILLVSNTESQSTVANAFSHNEAYVVGNEEDVVERIRRYCAGTTTTKSPFINSSTANSTHSVSGSSSLATRTQHPENRTTVVASTTMLTSKKPATSSSKSSVRTSFAPINISYPTNESPSTLEPTIEFTRTTPTTSSIINTTTNPAYTTTIPLSASHHHHHHH